MCRGHTYFKKEYNMSRFSFCFIKQGATPPITPSESDLVALKILPKQVSEFTSDDIGTPVLIPYTDPTGKILLNDGNIEFEVVGVNHHTSEEHQKTITLMTKNVIRNVAFDAAEPDNTNSIYKASGNNRWSVSNIRQWLNSNATNSWFNAQYTYDAPPTSDNVSGEVGAYADAPGFLAGFGSEVLQHFTDIINTTALCNNGGPETTIDKVFLPSYTEMGYGNNGDIAEGTHLSIKYTDNISRIKINSSGENYNYWTRSPFVDSSRSVWFVNTAGRNRYDYAYYGKYGLAPLLVLH